MPYIPILLLLFFLSFSYDFLGHKRGYNLGYYFIYLLLVVVSGFRYRIGADTFAYQDFFEDFSMKKYLDLLESMELAGKTKASKMSSGMLAKLKIAVTLARDSRLIMLDEPLNGIDIIARDKIIDIITADVDGRRSFILSSHLVDELEKIIDYAVFVKNGTIVKQGEASALRDEYGKSIVDIYKSIYS